MNSRSYVVLLILLSIACKNELVQSGKKESNTVNQGGLVTQKADSTNPFWNCYENRNKSFEIVSPEIINDPLIKLFTGKLAISDLNKILILHSLNYTYSDTSSLIDFGIFGYSPKRYNIKNTLEPYFKDDKTIDIKKLTLDESGKIFLPYRHDIDGESTVITIWKIQNDSLKYEGHYKNIFQSKYASVKPLLFYKGIRNSYLIGTTSFAEGGGYGEEYWVCKILENNFLQIKSIYSTGGEFSDDTLKTVSYKKHNNTLFFYEKIYKNTNEQISEKDFLFRKEVTKFDLK